MKATLEKRQLNEREVDAIIREIRKFPNPLNGKNFWLALTQVYILTSHDNLIGVCGVRKLDDWAKLGPFVVFEKYHGQGYGKMILAAVVKDYSNTNLYIGSRNSAVAQIVTNLGFHEVFNIWTLPHTVKIYLLKTVFEIFSKNYIKEFIRKKPIHEGPYRFFVREKA